MNFYLSTETCVKYTLGVIYKNLDKAASYGSLLALFLGASVLSAIEIVYFIFIWLMFEIRQFIT